LDRSSLKWSLVAEMGLSSFYSALTRGIFLVYLSELGLDLAGISAVSAGGGALSLLVGALAFKSPGVLSSRVREKLLLVHALERVCWMPMALAGDPAVLAILFSAQSASQALSSLCMHVVMYGSFGEDEVRDVVAGRISAGAASSIVGLSLATALLSLLEGPEKYEVIFLLGAGIGLLSTVLMSLQDLSHLEGLPQPDGVEEGGRVFAASAYQLLLSSSGVLLSMSWIPFLKHVAGYEDYSIAAMGLVGTAASLVSAPLWRSLSPRACRAAVALNSVVPLLIPFWTSALLQYPLQGLAASTFSGASLLATYLFARYSRWLGPVRSSALTLAVSGLGQLTASSLGAALDGMYEVAFVLSSAAKASALATTMLLVPEVSYVPPHVARAYANAAYGITLMGFRVSLAVTRETLAAALRLVALTLALLTLYVIYRVAIALLAG